MFKFNFTWMQIVICCVAMDKLLNVGLYEPLIAAVKDSLQIYLNCLNSVYLFYPQSIYSPSQMM